MANMQFLWRFLLVIGFMNIGYASDYEDLQNQVRNLAETIAEMRRNERSMKATITELVRSPVKRNTQGCSAETIAFSARLDKSRYSRYGYRLSSDLPFAETIKFERVSVNEGNGYDPATGVFTVPPCGAGIYYFSMYLHSNNNVMNVINIKLNKKEICTAMSDTHLGRNMYSQHTMMCSALARVSEGDKIKVELNTGTSRIPFDLRGD